MEIEQAIDTYLGTISDLTAVVSENYFFGLAPENVIDNYISIFEGVADRDYLTNDVWKTFQFSIYSTNLNTCKLLERILIKNLNTFKGDMEGLDIKRVVYQDRIEDYEDSTKLYSIKLNFMFWYVQNL